jgi:hypothetical protein
MAGVSLEAQLACAPRALAVRRATYPVRVARGELNHPQAARALAAMAALVQTLERLVREAPRHA